MRNHKIILSLILLGIFTLSSVTARGNRDGHHGGRNGRRNWEGREKMFNDLAPGETPQTYSGTYMLSKMEFKGRTKELVQLDAGETTYTILMRPSKLLKTLEEGASITVEGFLLSPAEGVENPLENVILPIKFTAPWGDVPIQSGRQSGRRGHHMDFNDDHYGDDEDYDY